MKANEQGAEGCWVEQPDCGIGLTPVEEREKEGRLKRRILDFNTVLRKSCQSQLGVSPKAKLPVSRVLRLTGVNTFAMFSHWLGAAPTDCGLGTA